VVERCVERSYVEEKKELVPPHKAIEPRRVRTSRRRMEITQHAPQLIRLVRHPYRMEKSRMSQVEGMDRARPAPVARERYRVAVEAAFAIDRTVTLPRPTELHLRPQRPPRLDAGAFLAQRVLAPEDSA